MTAVSLKDFNKALERGRPPSIVQLFPNSKALIVSGKVIDRAMITKGKAMTIAANGRNQFVIRGALKAAQRANAAIILPQASLDPKTLAGILEPLVSDRSVLLNMADAARQLALPDAAEKVFEACREWVRT